MRNRKKSLEKEENKDLNTKKELFFSISYILTLVILAVLNLLTYKLNILPKKYMFAFLGLSVLLALILGVLNIFRKKIFAKIMYYLILIPTFVFSLVGLKGIHSANKVFDGLSNAKMVTSKYYLVTDKENISFSKESKENVGVLNINENFLKAFDKLKEETKYEKKEYTNLNEMTSDLISSKLNIILLSEGEYNFIISTFPNLKDKLKIIHEFTLEEKVEEVKEDLGKKKDKNGSFILYIAGIDTRSGQNVNSLTDVNILATINPNTHEILLTNIPRDTYVQLKGTTGLKDKLTHAGIYGIDMSIGTIENLLGVDIDNFVRINFGGVIKAIDLIGGVNVYNDTAFTRGGVYYGTGNIYLDGKNALVFSRERKQLPNGDFDRGRNQQKIISAVIQKMTTDPKIIAKIDDIILAMSSEIYTNISVDTMKEYARKQINEMPKWQIKTNDLKLTGSYGRNYSMPNQEVYIGIVNEDSLKEIREEIEEVLYK